MSDNSTIHLHSIDEAKRPRRHNRGRQPDPHTVSKIRDLLDDVPLRPDLLIEHLHKLQDHYGYISKSQLVALASLLGLSQAEVWEVASFYAHFRLIEDSEIPASRPVFVRVCNNPSCCMAGSDQLFQELHQEFDQTAHPNPQLPEVILVQSPCIGRCTEAPAVQVGQNSITSANSAKIIDAVRQRLFKPVIPDYLPLKAYQAAGGYRLLAKCQSGEQSADYIIDELKLAGLKGMGGAGFPTAIKWQTVRQYPGVRYVVVNADEGEPGTCKDRHFLELDPHRMLEGMLISAWVINAECCYIYLRDEYPAARHILRDEILALEQAGLVARDYIQLRRGAGAYICGEESALIESLEGKRGFPRQRPPFVAERGLFDRPTLVNNVETLYWVREIIEHGGQWFSDLGRRGQQGMHSFTVSGRVNNPGVKLAPSGITLRELIDEYCDGMLDGHQLAAYLPGGASGGILPASKADIALGFGTLQEHGCFIGSAAIIVLSDKDNLQAVVQNLAHFFKDESCGQCSPCRLGTDRMLTLVSQSHWDEALIAELAELMADSSICGLGQAACNPALSLIRYFPELLQSLQSGSHDPQGGTA